MKIRNRLTLLFISIVAIIIIAASLAIYLLSAKYRREDFYSRLMNKASNTAKLLIEVDEVDVNLLRRIERDNPVSLPQEKIIIFDFRDELLFSTDEANEIKVNRPLLDRVRLENEVRYQQGEYEVLGFLFAGEYDRFVVIAAARDIYGKRRLQNLRTTLLIVIGISIVVVSFSGWVYAGRALSPISYVVKQVEDISITNLDKRVDEGNGKDEIAQLAHTFNDMLARLESSFIVQRNFIANASHELRTPLTAITGQLEVTLLNTRTVEEYQAVVKSVLEDIKSLNRLANRLLLLAHASSENAEKSLSFVRVDDLLWHVRDDLKKANPQYDIKIDLDSSLDEEEKLTIEGDEQLIKTMLSNLIENGCKFSGNQVEVYVHCIGQSVQIKFMDKGIGIPPGDLSTIFAPFHRGSNTQNIKGHGIGLSLVERIVKLHKGSIEVVSMLGEGTTFTITFPTQSPKRSD